MGARGRGNGVPGAHLTLAGWLQWGRARAAAEILSLMEVTSGESDRANQSASLVHRGSGENSTENPTETDLPWPNQISQHRACFRLGLSTLRSLSHLWHPPTARD